MRKALTVFVLLVFLLYGGCQLFIYQHRLSVVPTGMGVSRVLYSSENEWGFGPGGNETGIIVYEMPHAVAQALTAGGLEYLQRLPRKITGDWHGRYDEWMQTPIVIDGHWPGDDSTIRQSKPQGIAAYLFRYGFFVPLDKDIEQMVDDALFNPGNYYAYGRIGMIILIPSAQRIVYAYAG